MGVAQLQNCHPDPAERDSGSPIEKIRCRNKFGMTITYSFFFKNVSGNTSLRWDDRSYIIAIIHVVSFQRRLESRSFFVLNLIISFQIHSIFKKNSVHIYVKTRYNILLFSNFTEYYSLSTLF